jgi:hypothetical protein
VAVVSTTDAGNTNTITARWIDIDTHATTATVFIFNAKQRTAVIPASAAGQPSGIVFGGFVEGSGEDSTNALWYLSTNMVHMAARDLRNSAEGVSNFFEPLGLSLDTSTGRLAWASLYKTSIAGQSKSGAAVFTESFSVTTLALNSTARRQAAMAGGQLYIAGGPVQFYDGRLLTECQFLEVPRIISLAGDTSGGLSVSADYSYVLVFEYALPDGTFVRSPPSLPVDITTGASEDEVNVTVAGLPDIRVMSTVTIGGWRAISLTTTYTHPTSIVSVGIDPSVTERTPTLALMLKAALVPSPSTLALRGHSPAHGATPAAPPQRAASASNVRCGMCGTRSTTRMRSRGSPSHVNR